MAKPNWRNPEDYARERSPSSWAWEFLRRNPEYRKAWLRYLDVLGALSKDPDPRPVPDELAGAFEWGIANSYPDPDEDEPDIEWLPAASTGFTMTVEDSPPSELGRRTVGQILPDHEGKVPVVFDLSLPINPQIAAAKKELLQLQKEAKEHGMKVKEKTSGSHLGEDEWPILLRVLDADAECPKPSDTEIASILYTGIDEDYSGVKWVRDKRNQAHEHRDRVFRRIAHSEF